MSKRIYLTVDTECHDISKENEYITGKTKSGEKYGLEKILQLGAELKIPVNVFIDIVECHRYGDEYTQKIVDLVHKYGHTVCLHVHPDYIGDPNKKHLWEYSKDEQHNILKIALDDYERFCGKHDKIVFRAGAWGVNNDTYEVLRELIKIDVDVLDLSYVYHSRWRCHLSYEEYGAINAPRMYKGVECLPNTTYNRLSILGKKHAFGLCVPNTCYQEFKNVIDDNTLNDITYCMHSWDFIKRWFFLPGMIAGDKALIRRFRKCVSYAKKQGYIFSSLYDYNFKEEDDQFQDLCRTKWGKIKCLWYNYYCFARMGRSFKKYAPLYFLQFFIPIILVLFALLFIII